MGCGRGFLFYGRSVMRDAPREDPINSKKEDPLEILKMRFANGEISAEEFTHMKNIILGNEIESVEDKKTIGEQQDYNKPKEKKPISQKPKVSLRKSEKMWY